MTTAVALGPRELRAAMVTFRDALRTHQQLLNRLNVYPVPDGDTGTNMALTLDAVVKELDALRTSSNGSAGMTEVCRAMAHGSLMGARGNSGVILSQLLRGLAERLGVADEAGPDALADALVIASDLARKAVVRPVEGTILTVARAAGEGASAGARMGAALLGVVERARDAAGDALAKTPTMLEPLARAGVVDAGGAGYVLLFDSLLSVIDGRPLPVPEDDTADSPPAGAVTGVAANGRGAAGTGAGPATAARGAAAGDGESASEDAGHDLRYEVMYFLDAPDDAIDAFKEVWSGIGDSIVVVGGDGVWNCHIHTNDIGSAIEAAIDIGRPHQIRVTDLAEQVQEERWVRDAARDEADHELPASLTAVVAVVAGDGLGRIFRSLGAQRLVRGGQTMNPSTEQLLEAVESLGSDNVILLPNNDNIEAVAMQVDGLTEKTVRVVPTGSIVEGFAALLAYDPAADVDENVEAMRASARRVLPGAVARAVRDSETEAGPVREGDWMGLSREGVVAISDSPEGAALQLLDALLEEGHELVTIIEGEGSSAAATRRITEWLHEEHAYVAEEVHHGGQPLYPYLLGIE
ncbi:MAG TPA: DAK2 domain-containing protein [Acidimicrobiales bacterium]|nr:DAK2 domain-containing protein [Acidimicrobiales bacterium]